MKHISNEDLRQAISNPDNQAIIRKVCVVYAKSLSPDTLKACGEAAVWRCLQSHRTDMGQKFTSSLYRFVHWECLRELSETKFHYIELADDTHDNSDDKISQIESLILQECLDVLSERDRQIVVARYFENRTLADIGRQHNYSKQGIQNILTRSIATMQKLAGAGV